jgi:hypothetical protein
MKYVYIGEALISAGSTGPHESVMSCGVMDTACNGMVCGHSWLRNYVKNLKSQFPKEQWHLATEKSSEMYKFGSGEPQRARYRVRLPVWINGESGFLWADVVQNERLPFLLSKPAMKELGVRLELDTGFTWVRGRRRALPESLQGHILLPLVDKIWRPREDGGQHATEVAAPDMSARGAAGIEMSEATSSATTVSQERSVHATEAAPTSQVLSQVPEVIELKQFAKALLGDPGVRKRGDVLMLGYVNTADEMSGCRLKNMHLEQSLDNDGRSDVLKTLQHVKLPAGAESAVNGIKVYKGSPKMLRLDPTVSRSDGALVAQLELDGTWRCWHWDLTQETDLHLERADLSAYKDGPVALTVLLFSWPCQKVKQAELEVLMSVVDESSLGMQIVIYYMIIIVVLYMRR